MKILARFAKDESGATAIEYGLIAACISVAIIAVVQGVGTKLNSTFTQVQERPQVRVRSELVSEGSGASRGLPQTVSKNSRPAAIRKSNKAPVLRGFLFESYSRQIIVRGKILS